MGAYAFCIRRHSFIYSTKFPRQILRLQVRIPPQHTQILAPGDARDLHGVEPLFEQPGGRLVAQVRSEGSSGTTGGLVTRSLVLSALAGTCLAVVAACTNSPATTKATDERIGFVACQAPRPEACTMHYDPVCGEVNEGVSKAYSNACVACSDRNVTGYRAGACSNAGDAEQPPER
jgi:hypothetical protein